VNVFATRFSIVLKLPSVIATVPVPPILAPIAFAAARAYAVGSVPVIALSGPVPR
jgi:hypothetical protein